MYSLLHNDWSNLSVLHKNRLPARAHFVPCEGPKQAIQSPFESPRATLLNGEWDFTWLESPLLADEALLRAPANGQNTIPVPMNWQYAGYGALHYTDMDYPFPVDPPNIPAAGETGVYKRAFFLENMGSNRFFLRFEGVESAFHLLVNGEAVGYSQGSRMPAEFEITQFVRAGENQLCVAVYQYCDGSYLEAQDMWWLGGIIRDVVLLRRPPVLLEDLVLDPGYDLEKGCGVLHLRPGFDAAAARLEVAVYDSGGETVLARLEDVRPDGETLAVAGTAPWNAEQPALYPVVATLYDRAGGEVLESTCLPTGFRHIEIRDGRLLLNGRRIFMKGYNRHEYDPEKGRVVTRESTRADLLLVKAAGMNAVRCSHYPNNPFFYQLCDEIGLYVIDECDMEADGLNPVDQVGRLAQDPAWREAHLDRVERMVKRDRNFACVLLWSLGNESGYGENFAAMYRWCKANEPTRPVHYEGDFKNQSVDVSSTMYTSIGDLAELDLADDPVRPHILCEFGHAMGNGPGDLAEYFELAYSSRRIQGVFAWEFKDHGIKDPKAGGKTRWLYGGDFGEKYHNANFCLDGYLMADGSPSPAFYEYEAVAASLHFCGFDIDTMQAALQNRWDFTPMDVAELHYSFVYGEERFPGGIVALPAAKAGEIVKISVPAALPNVGEEQPLWLDLCAVMARDAAGFKKGGQVGQSRVLLREANVTPCPMASAPEVCELPDGLLVKGEGFTVKVSKVDGWLHGYSAGGREIMPEGPKLNLFRAYTDNDVKDRPVWQKNHLDSMCFTVNSLAWQTHAGYAGIQVGITAAPGAIAWGAKLQVEYKISAAGEIVMSLAGDFAGEGLPDCLPKIGTQARLSKGLAQIAYRGLGPGENYPDSHAAARDGIWRADASALGVRYLRPQENGNRTRTQWAVATDGETGLVMAFSRPLDFALRAFTDDALANTAHDADLAEADHWVLNLDYKNAGLGSASCGPQALKHNRVYPLPFAWQMAFVPVVGGDSQGSLQKARGLLENLRGE